MAFPVSLWKINKKENSTYRPTGSATTYQCVSNADFDILNPDIPLNIGLTENPTAWNYAYIAAFNRYYFITDWRVQNGMWWCSLKCDVLASWRDEIGGQELYVDRSAAEFDGNIVDTTYPATADFSVTSVPFTLTDADQHAWKTNGSYADGTFIMGVIGKGGAVNFWAFPYTHYLNFMKAVFNYDYGFADEQVKAVFNPIQYITSVIWVPFVYAGTGTVNVDFGWWTIGGQNAGAYALGAGAVHTFDVTVNLPKHPQQTRGAWLNGSQFTRYKLKLPCYGMLDVQGFDMVDATSITISVDLDLSTGKAIAYVKPNTVNVNTQVVEFQAGVNVQVSQITSNTWSGLLNAAHQTGNVGAAIANSVAGAWNTVAGGIGSFLGISEMPFTDKVSTAGTTGSMAATLIDGALIGVFQMLAEENLPDRGRPLCKRRTVGNLTGFMQISDADISIPCTLSELAQIRGYMNGGFFYE